MVFVSYAQNLEDVALYRALHNVSDGFYVDVGAQDPVVHSVTKAFYERGWRGINIEPTSHYFQRLMADRVEDINLQVAAGNNAGALTLFEISSELGLTGLSTAREDIAKEHIERGFDARKVEVPMQPLTKIFQDHSVKEIHFLKVDAEGFELEVFQGLDLAKFRPWIILAESLAPLSSRDTSDRWEAILLRNGYEFCCSDRLNRFYVASEHAALKEELSKSLSPVFDEFVTHSETVYRAKVTDLETTVEELKQKLGSKSTKTRSSKK